MRNARQFTKHFNSSEFDSPDLLNSGLKMQANFITLLQSARIIANVAFIIVSGFRTKKHNIAIGGRSDSSHLLGKAADIACTNSTDRFRIIKSLLDAGFNRVGIHESFIHVDNDVTKDANVIWIYE